MVSSPFPYDRLPAIDRAEARARSTWARSGPAHDLRDAASAMSSLLGARIAVDVERAWARASGLPADADLPTALLEGPASVALTLEPQLADALVGRALGVESARGNEGAAGPLGDAERGVLAYVLGRWLAPSRWHVAAVLACPAPLAYAALSIRWPLAIEIDASRYAADVWLPAVAPAAPRAHRMDETPVEIAIVVGRARLAIADVRGLRARDTLIPDAIGVDTDGRGAVELRALGTRWMADGDPSAGFAVRTRREWTNMKATNEEAAWLEHAADQPVTLTVELARVSVPFGTVAALAPGAVLETGHAIGSEVTLRLGDRVVARGELVQVDGEIGVRIVRVDAG